METLAEANAKILDVITSQDIGVRTSFWTIYDNDAKAFSESLAMAILEWRQLDARASGSEKHAYVSALVFTAITLHVQSMKLFLGGLPVASGNLFRQVFELVALALLCSEKNSTVLEHFIDDKYSTNNAIRDVLRRTEVLGLKKDAVVALKEAQRFYNMYSHPTKSTISSVTSFSDNGMYVGAGFDAGKRGVYDKEIRARVELASVFSTFVAAVSMNVEKW